MIFKAKKYEKGKKVNVQFYNLQFVKRLKWKIFKVEKFQKGKTWWFRRYLIFHIPLVSPGDMFIFSTFGRVRSETNLINGNAKFNLDLTFRFWAARAVTFDHNMNCFTNFIFLTFWSSYAFKCISFC